MSAAKKIVEIPVEALSKGHYVSRLDRPWIESPFLFQGFAVESDEQIAQLRGLCSKVYIEVTKEEADALLSRAPRPKAAPPPQSPLLAELTRNPLSRVNLVPPTDPVPVKTELQAAKKVFGEARQTVTRIFDRLRQRGGDFDSKEVATVVDSMIESIFRNRDAMSWLLRLKDKDDYLYSHSLSSSVIALAFGRHLGLDKETLRVVGTGVMVLDIGKTQLPEGLLRKAAKPTPAEWLSLRQHVDLGLELLMKGGNMDERILTMVRTHHERLDGTGYPNRLAGDAIPLLGRIAAIVDSYDAMTSVRPYAPGVSTYEAIRELTKLGGTAFQPELVEVFIQSVGVFPTGSLVELNTGEVAIVMAQNRFRRLRPQIMVVLDTQKTVLNDFVEMDLHLQSPTDAAGNPTIWITKGLEPGAHGIDPAEFFI